MGVYIKGMELPKPGKLVLVEIDENGDVFAAYDGGRTKLAEYTAIPVPNHGRLGDLDELAKTFREDAVDDWNKHATPLNWSDAFEDVAGMIDDAPTIIPADKEEES